MLKAASAMLKAASAMQKTQRGANCGSTYFSN